MLKISRKIKDGNVLDKLSQEQLLTEKILSYEEFIHQNQRLYDKFLNRRKKIA